MKRHPICWAVLLGLVMSFLGNARAVVVTKLGELGGKDYRSLAVRGNYAYCAIDQSGLAIIDISVPTSPFIKGQYNTTGNSRSVKVVGDYAYVADKYSGVQIINITNPASPTWAGSCHYAPGWAEDLDISGNYACTSYDSGGFRVFDIANPTGPYWVSSFDTKDDTNGVAVSGNYVYIVLEDDGLKVVNIADPYTPALASWFKQPRYGKDVAVAGNYAYYSDSNVGLMVIDVSNPAAPVLKGTCDTPGGALGIAVSGNYAFVADQSSGLQVINISDPSAPTTAGSYNEGSIYGSDVAVAGDYVYMTDGWYNKFYIFKISTGPAAAITVSSPNGGESWPAGSTHNITWTQGGLTGNVAIDLYRDGSFQANIGTAAANAGTFSWKISSQQTPANTYKIKIYQDSTADFSDNDFSITEPGGTSPNIVLNRTALYFGAVGSICTSGQTIIIENSGTGTLNWTAVPDQNWIQVTPGSGSGSGTFEVSVNPAGLGNGPVSATISVTDPAAGNSPQQINVNLHIYGDGSVPFGDFTTPLDLSTVSGSIPVTGWVLDDVEVTGVKIYRDPVTGEGDGLVYIGDAVFVEGARPDVEQSYPGYPLNYRAGWGYMMLTNFLPNSGTGTYTIYALAADSEGNTVALGQKTITGDNVHAVKPFGAIDTPAAGGLASGNNFSNWGWVLTPQPNSIPTDGTTLEVFVDGVKLGNPTYNIYRSDVATLFPGYTNSQGAAGCFYLDTTAYENGVHSIFWTAVDNAGNADGIGSRYFTVQNVNSPGKTQAEKFPGPASIITPAGKSQVQWLESTGEENLEPVQVTFGINSSARRQTVYPDVDGFIDIETRELERVKIDLDETRWRGYQLSGDRWEKLPAGSTFDVERGIFYWQVGPGYIGEYSFVLVRSNWDGTREKKFIKIRVVPRN